MADNQASLGQQAKLGVIFSSAGRLAITVLIFARTIVLLRLLDVRDFGVAQLCFMIVDFSTTVGNFGFSTAQLQQLEEVRYEQTNTLFIIDLALKVVLFALLMLGLAHLAAYFHEPQLISLLPAMGAYMLIDCFSVPGLTLLARRMQFGTTAKIQFASKAVESVVAIGMAVAGFGVWSLVFARIAASVSSALIASVAAGWWPSLKIDLKGTSALVRFGGWLLLRNVFNYLVQNVDYFIVGRYLGTRELGFYSKAFEISRMPHTRVTRSLVSVLFPAFSKIQGEPERVKRALRKVVLAVSLVSYPALVGLALTADPLVVLLFGERWSPMQLPLQIMCLTALIRTVDPILLSVFTALGAVRLTTVRRALEFVAISVAALIGVRYGIAAVAAAVSIVALITTLATAALASKVKLESWRDYLRPQLAPLAATVVMAAAVLATHFATAALTHASWTRLALLVLAGIVAYPVSLLILRSREVVELLAEGKGDVAKLGAGLRRKLSGGKPSQ